MAYNNAIPQPTDVKSQSQQDILGNFAAIKTLVDVNHVTFDTPDQGKHKFVTFPVQGSAPSFAAGEQGLYNKLYATTSKNELYSHIQTFAGTSEIPGTASVLGVSTPSANTSGWTYLPSGIILRWANLNGTGLTTVTLGGTAPSFSAILSVLVTPYSSSTSDDDFAVRLVSIDSTTQFKVYFSSRSSTGAAAGEARALIIGR